MDELKQLKKEIEQQKEKLVTIDENFRKIERDKNSEYIKLINLRSDLVEKFFELKNDKTETCIGGKKVKVCGKRYTLFKIKYNGPVRLIDAEDLEITEKECK